MFKQHVQTPPTCDQCHAHIIINNNMAEEEEELEEIDVENQNVGSHSKGKEVVGVYIVIRSIPHYRVKLK